MMSMMSVMSLRLHPSQSSMSQSMSMLMSTSHSTGGGSSGGLFG